MTLHSTRLPKPPCTFHENLDNERIFDSIPSSSIDTTSPHSPPTLTMLPQSAAQRQVLAAERAEERFQQLHEEDLKYRREDLKYRKAQTKEIEDRAADRERQLLQEQEDRTEMLRLRKNQEDRAVELHALSLAAMTTRSLMPASSINPIDEPGELLPSTASILNLLLPGVPNKEILKVFRGTFLPNNLSRLRTHQLWIEPKNDILIVNSILSMRPKEGTAKDYPSVEVWVEGFLNYMMILVVMCKDLSADLIPRMLAFCNQVIWLSATYQITPLITMALEHHAMVIQKNQLEPANWKVSSNFLDIYCNAGTHKSTSVTKRPRAFTDISKTCNNFNKGKCDLGKDCKFPHVCSKCGGPHAIRQCK
jgi:hypothetical protein